MNLWQGGSRISQTGAPSQKGGGRQPIIWPIFAENWLKWKKMVREGGRTKFDYVYLALYDVITSCGDGIHFYSI